MLYHYLENRVLMVGNYYSIAATAVAKMDEPDEYYHHQEIHQNEKEKTEILAVLVVV